jgi:hypothetical protein
MNKSDCDKIAYILCEGYINEEVRMEFFKLDSRIEEMYEDWKHYVGRSSKVDERFTEIMTEQHGEMWALRKITSDGAMLKDNYEQARKDVYGEDYHPSLFKR